MLLSSAMLIGRVGSNLKTSASKHLRRVPVEQPGVRLVGESVRDGDGAASEALLIAAVVKAGESWVRLTRKRWSGVIRH